MSALYLGKTLLELLWRGFFHDGRDEGCAPFGGSYDGVQADRTNRGKVLTGV